MDRGFFPLRGIRFCIKVQEKLKWDLGIQMKFIYSLDKNSGISYTVTVLYNTVIV